MKLKAKDIVWPALCVGLLVIVGLQWQSNRTLTRQADELLSQLEDYQKKEGNSYVVERISKQMEDIAYQQKDVAEKQREEAVYQMGIAKQMRARAEEEQRKAQEFAQNVVEARNMAENQRELAVQQQHQAEHARNVADTLSNVALGRALALLSNIQYRSGNKDLSALLAYASWLYTSEFKGDVYQVAVFNALGQNSESFMTRNIHKGGVTRILPDPARPDAYVSVSNYGEVRRWQYTGVDVDDQLLFEDAACSFRDACLDQDYIYALSYSGELLRLSFEGDAQRVSLPEREGWMQIVSLDADRLALASSRQVYIYEKPTCRLLHTIPTPAALSAIGKKDSTLMVFGQEGGMWSLSDDGTLHALPCQVKEPITTYEWSDVHQLAAVGTQSGNIYLLDKDGLMKRQLVGHRSRITQLAFAGRHLYSSSYDRTVSLWDMDARKQEAVSLHTLSGWVHCFCLSADNTIWTGDESGAVSRVMTSPDEMAALVRKKLKRDFTDDEWIYFVGKNVPRRWLKTN